MGADPVKLGTILFTLVEPHRGQAVAYNRWYERDHFYAGCMVGPWCFAGRRFVATSEGDRLWPNAGFLPQTEHTLDIGRPV